ncbi:biotin/acetyl-CoA-carboxylase ligase [Beutenbergia cavernae DSM 12333]|uniref:biotin--[biotin carboxyl-carrier protein] ligase n=1 Tax=Beutenbergia cavernae (strain ATCC BAA-8 / DSM 12333 / CCUG 43141 / JCM 11478 / NBRC 16432 / NCIMB 13614 / HKI 0122) TaxID=471853 RepID=C5C109_BEUC1|nr:biotin--[acetyl-CoA-carboxylase] ligase [Beutenbergia cavernae]ACQ79413.1 biotin/acetyl-CoA-carboxylase ligase [Beutenbergia cavernae DSM 12333]
MAEPGPSVFPRLDVVPRTGSTNDDVVAGLRADPAAWPHLAALRAEHQDAGRGRTGRGWETPPGTALTVSIVLRPRVAPERWPVLTLLGGFAVVTGLRQLGAPAALKWPNDVVLPAQPAIEGWGPLRKVGGVLADAVPGATTERSPGAVVLGVGVNVAQAADELPVPWATSLALAGIVTDAEHVLDAVGTALARAFTVWEDADGDPQTSGLLDALRAVTTTLDEAVAVQLPGGHVLEGRAVDLDTAGRLLVDVGGHLQAVDAGDVRHLRLA